MGAFDQLPILRDALACKAAYQTGRAMVDTLHSACLEWIDDLEVPEGRVVIAGDYEDLVVAFRGTADIADVVTDARICPGEFRALDLTGAPLVHTGFRDVWLKLRPWVHQAIARHATGRRVGFRGHSEGGGTATCAAVDCPVIERDLVTFGCPRVGLGEFVGQVTALGFPITRVVHHRDIVPTVPGLPYAHVCAPLRIDDDGRIVGRLRGWLADLCGVGEQALADLDGDALAAHPIDRYIAAIQALAARETTHRLTRIPA